MESLDEWIDRQYRHSTASMLQSVSSGIVMERPGFGQVVRARKGSIVASPVLGAYDPEPDYFFHWFRDSAIVVDALRLLFEDSRNGLDTREHLGDFVRFSLSLRDLDGRALNERPEWRERVTHDFTGFLRSEAELTNVNGDATSAETRVNPDGSLDISRWPRPQFDGPAMRALALLRWLRSTRLDGDLRRSMETLLRGDLAVVHKCAHQPCFDIWEEERGFHYYVLRVSAAALRSGAAWLADRGERLDSHTYDTEAGEIIRRLDGYWSPHQRFFKSRILDPENASGKELDISVILAAIHVDGDIDAHSAHDPRMHATLSQLETLFGAAYEINRRRPSGRAPAMGRYAGDVYFSGGAYYFSTLGAAEFYFQAAARARDPKPLRARGDAFLRTVRAFTPASGDLSEQFDQRTGVQRSARHLAWSYAAFISCVAARRRNTES